jgi:MFS family permease
LLGFGLSIACVAAPALVAELTYPSHRGKMTALYNTNWFVGAIIAGECQCSLSLMESRTDLGL